MQLLGGRLPLWGIECLVVELIFILSEQFDQDPFFCVAPPIFFSFALHYLDLFLQVDPKTGKSEIHGQGNE